MNEIDNGVSPEEHEGEDQPEEGDEEQVQEYTPEQIAELEKKASGYDAILPDYTRKSQRLSELEGADDKVQKPEEKVPSYRQPGWQPKSYEDLAKAIDEAREAGKTDALAALQAEKTTRDNATKELDDFIDEVKSKDKTFDEQAFYKYAAKHDFPIDTVASLKSVYSVYSENSKGGGGDTKPADKRVAGKTSGEGKGPDYTDLRTGGGSIHDVASEALARNKSNS